MASSLLIAGAVYTMIYNIMIQKKVCMVGAFATGKTSLVTQFVKGTYSDQYQTTVGVKLDKKQIKTQETIINMVLWDIHGEDEFQAVKMSYLRGAAAYLLIIDGTRRTSLDIALVLKEKVFEYIGDTPFIAVINKCDLQHEWEITEKDIAMLKAKDFDLLRTSAKTAFGVEKCFQQLADKIVAADNKVVAASKSVIMPLKQRTNSGHC